MGSHALNQIHHVWRDIGRADGLRAALLLIGPLGVFMDLALLLEGIG